MIMFPASQEEHVGVDDLAQQVMAMSPMGFANIQLDDLRFISEQIYCKCAVHSVGGASVEAISVVAFRRGDEGLSTNW